MNDRDQRRHHRLSRVQAFGKEHAGDFSATSKARIHFANIDRHLDALDACVTGRPHTRVSTATLLDALLLDFENIARTARTIGLTERGFAAPYQVPDDLDETSLSAHADALLQFLENQPHDDEDTRNSKSKLRDIFTAYELPPAFVEDLRADREAIRMAGQETESGDLEQTESISRILTLAASDVAELDTIMHNKYSREAEKLAAWRTASRVERAPQRDG